MCSDLAFLSDSDLSQLDKSPVFIHFRCSFGGDFDSRNVIQCTQCIFAWYMLQLKALSRNSITANALTDTQYLVDTRLK